MRVLENYTSNQLRIINRQVIQLLCKSSSWNYCISCCFCFHFISQDFMSVFFCFSGKEEIVSSITCLGVLKLSNPICKVSHAFSRNLLSFLFLDSSLYSQISIVVIWFVNLLSILKLNYFFLLKLNNILSFRLVLGNILEIIF